MEYEYQYTYSTPKKIKIWTLRLHENIHSDKYHKTKYSRFVFHQLYNLDFSPYFYTIVILTLHCNVNDFFW